MDSFPTPLKESATGFERIVLASASPRRSFLLDKLGVEFIVRPSDVEEHEEPDSCPRETVLHNAQIKASHIAQSYPDDLVLGCDTIVALHDEVLHKPADMDAAYAMLGKLSGITHTVYTGVCLVCLKAGLDEAHYITSEVTFKELDRDLMQQYFQIVNPLDKAGAYGIQEGRELIIDHVVGSINNVMGLPIEFLRERFLALDIACSKEVAL